MPEPAPEGGSAGPPRGAAVSPARAIQRLCPECEDEMQRSPLSASSDDRIQRLCPECEEEEVQRQPMEEPEDEEESLQAKGVPGRTAPVTSELEARIGALRGSGNMLPSSERAFFEPRFGIDFGEVQVHTGSEAADLAQRVEARAFTLGQSVVFGQGEYRPGTEAGRRLLGHELTHVVQQSVREEAQPIQRTDWGHSTAIASTGNEWALV